MARTLLDEFSSLLTPDALGRAGSAFGESPDGIGRALGAAAPALLAGLLGKVSDPRGAQDLLGVLNDPTLAGGGASSLAALLGPGGASAGLSDLAGRFLASVFGTRTDAVASAVGQASNVQPRTASALLPIASTILLGLLSERTRSQGLNASGLAGLLLGQRDAILAALPAGLGTLLDVGRLRSVGAAAAGDVASAVTERRRPWWPLAAAIALLLAAWWLFRSLGLETPRPAAPVASAPPPAAGVSAPPPTEAKLFERTLSTGYTLRVPETGIERQLVIFIEGGQPVSDTAWFDFDRLRFETGSATLEPASRAQILEISEILKAYPRTRAKIGGYTDNTGDPAQNRALSQARAESVVNALVGLGVAADRLEAEGYGDAHPAADNATEEGRARNWRIALRVTAK
jgi:outer membrane protein OmpA-like peptidoglycan-associated protein